MESQSFLIEQYKAHYEANPAKHSNMNIPFFTQVADNKWGMVMNTFMGTPTKPSGCNQRMKVSQQHKESYLLMQTLLVVLRSPRRTSTTLSFTAIVAISPKMLSFAFLLLTGCVLTCTYSISKSLAFVLGNVLMNNDDNRVAMLKEDLMISKIGGKVYQANNFKIRIAITAYHNGNRNIILVASKIHKQLTMDFETMSMKIVRLYIEN